MSPKKEPGHQRETQAQIRSAYLPMNPLLQQILPLGHPSLHVVAETVRDLHELEVQMDKEQLLAVLDAFREEYGFGRAMAAPQIGAIRRMVALHLDDKPFVMFNPHIIWSSEDQFTMWDDCMCFPSILVRVKRHRNISIKFRDEEWKEHVWNDIDQATSELLQHELDHLDGVLAVDRAENVRAIISREAYDHMPGHFKDMVDYVIPLLTYQKAAPVIRA